MENLDGIQWDTALGLVFDAVYPLSFSAGALHLGLIDLGSARSLRSFDF